MRSKAVIVARVLLGLVFLVFGLNGFLHWFPLPTMKAAAAEFMGGLRQRVLLPAAFWDVYDLGGRAPDWPLCAARVDRARAGHREHRRRPPLPRSIRIPLQPSSSRLSSSSSGRTARRSARCCTRVMTPRPPVEENAIIGTKPYAKLKYREVKGRQMAYIDEGEGDAIVFQHGQPASSCVWRNVMPHLEEGPADRLRPHRDDQFREAQPFGTGSLSLLRTSRLSFRALGCARSRRPRIARAGRLGRCTRG